MGDQNGGGGRRNVRGERGGGAPASPEAPLSDSDYVALRKIAPGPLMVNGQRFMNPLPVADGDRLVRKGYALRQTRGENGEAIYTATPSGREAFNRTRAANGLPIERTANGQPTASTQHSTVSGVRIERSSTGAGISSATQGVHEFNIAGERRRYTGTLASAQRRAAIYAKGNNVRTITYRGTFGSNRGTGG